MIDYLIKSCHHNINENTINELIEIVLDNISNLSLVVFIP